MTEVKSPFLLPGPLAGLCRGGAEGVYRKGSPTIYRSHHWKGRGWAVISRDSNYIRTTKVRKTLTV